MPGVRALTVTPVPSSWRESSSKDLLYVVFFPAGEHESRCNVVPTDPYIEVGSDIKIVCHTCVNEKIYWTLQNREIDETLSNIINSSYTVLSLRNFTEHSATVVCHEKATGDIIGGTTIKTYSKPSKISCILDYDNQNASGVPELLTCNWEHQINPSKEIYYTVLSSSWLHPSQSEICNSQITTCTSKYKNISDKISMFGSFNVTVRANSSVFEAYSETQEFTFNQIWKIVRPKLDVTTRPGGVLVKWTQMYSSVECHCQVKYNKWLIDTTLYGEERGNITVKNLESCSTYTFSVRCALDKAPWSDWSLEKRVLTKLNMTDVKLRLWRNIAEPEKHGLRKVHAMWTVRKLMSLFINYTETLCGNSSYDVDVNQNAHRIILTVSHNDAVFSEDSVYVPAARESLPQVTDVQTTTLEGVIEISWKAPGQPVSGYMIDYTHNGNQFYWKESTNTNVTLTDLLDKTPYNITVTPLFDGKTGHGTQALQICSRVGGNVTIIDVQAYDKSAFVSWDVKSQEACSGVVVRYTVFYNTQKGPQLNVSVDRTKQFILLKDLTPDTQYHVYIQATALTGTTQSSEWLFMTKRFVNKPHESPFDIVYPEELEGMTTPSLPTGCKSNIVRDQTEEYTVPDVVPAPDLQNKDPRESEDMLHPSSPEESTALLLSERNQSSPYRSQSSKEAPAQRTSKQSKRAALEQEDKTTSATVYVTLEMFEQDNGQSTETVT
uniref:Interleukin-6 receptor subunit beta-like n=1 Tax=Labrus bergylta TaxID=56723 RepID=A0A3Q3F758_9LABR